MSLRKLGKFVFTMYNMFFLDKKFTTLANKKWIKTPNVNVWSPWCNHSPNLDAMGRWTKQPKKLKLSLILTMFKNFSMKTTSS
jgi:hypothetical protein